MAKLSQVIIIMAKLNQTIFIVAKLNQAKIDNGYINLG